MAIFIKITMVFKLYFQGVFFKIFNFCNTRFYYKCHIFKQHQPQTGKKNKQKIGNTLTLDFCYLKSNYFLHPLFILFLVVIEEKC